jgi:pimeloyl-ACP methyl ester carboxylesterase
MSVIRARSTSLGSESPQTQTEPRTLGERSRVYASTASALRRPAGSDGAEIEPELLLLHGLGGRSDQLVGLFDSTPIPLIAPDQRAHGADRSTVEPWDVTFDVLARDQLALLDRFGIPRIAVAGVSMGAGVALTMASLAPERVRGLLLLRPAWLDRPWPENLDGFRLIADVLAGEVGPEFGPDATQRLRQDLMASPRYRAILDRSAAAAGSLSDQMLDPGVLRRRELLRALPGSVPTWPRERPEVPIIVVGADADPVHPMDMAVAWATRLGADLKTVPSRDSNPAGYQRGLVSAALGFVDQLAALRGRSL